VLRDTPSRDVYSMYKTMVCCATHLPAICTVFTTRRFALGHTSARSACNYQCFQAPYLFRRCALRHTSARSAQFLQVFLCVGHVFFQFWRCVFRTPPCDLHSFYNNICVSEVRETRDFIILNKGLMTPPWRERTKRSQGHAGFRILVRFLSRVGADAADTGVPVAPPSKRFLCCCAYSMREF